MCKNPVLCTCAKNLVWTDVHDSKNPARVDANVCRISVGSDYINVKFLIKLMYISVKFLSEMMYFGVKTLF